MHIPAAFRVSETDSLHHLIRQHPLGTLITAGTAGIEATPLPFLFDPAAGGRGALRAHMARANPQLGALREGADCLVLFQGPQGYVSPSWYPSKREHHRVVPTWNYTVVQVRGHATVIDDAVWLREHVAAQTAAQEGRRSEPWAVDDAPDDFIARMLQAIVGIDIPIDTIDGKFKLSQNRDRADRDAVLAALGSSDDPHRNPSLADAMRDAMTREP